jgi:hypothetical protein
LGGLTNPVGGGDQNKHPWATGIGAALGSFGPGIVGGLKRIPRWAELEKIKNMLPREAQELNRWYSITDDIPQMGDYRREMLKYGQKNPDVIKYYQDKLRGVVGDIFPAYRGRGWLGKSGELPNLTEPRGYSLSPRTAESFATVSPFKNVVSGDFTKLRASPESVIFPGNATELELILDPTKANFRHTLSIPERKILAKGGKK